MWIRAQNGWAYNLDLAYNLWINPQGEQTDPDAPWHVLATFPHPDGSGEHETTAYLCLCSNLASADLMISDILSRVECGDDVYDITSRPDPVVLAANRPNPEILVAEVAGFKSCRPT